ncbi:MAG: hypothetical protein GC168_19495 [Candidatus Hydrogenedens sp.]|nr:hypothetical protein [Candidatus Hydrogenedens sp.]
MRCTRAALLGATGVLLLAGCQHIPPHPLDFNETETSLRDRDIGIEPVRAFADALASADRGPAGPFDTSNGLSLAEGQAVALWFNPDLRIARLHAQQALAVAEASGRWSDPELGGEWGRKSVDASEQGFLHDAGSTARDWIRAGSLSITIPLSGRPQAERRLWASLHDAAAWQAAEAEWETLAQVETAWVRWSASTERVNLLEEHLTVLDEFTDAAAALARAGEVMPSNARLLEIERLRRKSELANAAAETAQSHAALLGLLGLLPDAPVVLNSQLSVLAPEDDAFEPKAHPALQRLEAGYRAAEDRLRLELRKQYPDITLSPAYADEEDETSLRVGLGIPLPVWNANRQGIAEALAGREIARAQAEAGYQQLISEEAQARAALRGSRDRRGMIENDIIPVVDAQLRESLALLQAGELDLIVLHEALAQALAVKEELLEAALGEAEASARLTAATARGMVMHTSTESTDDHE